jgi:putative restriction endonuclease
MPNKDLIYYINRFESLRRDYKNGGAPHKPILLISIIQAFQEGIYNSSEITITPELVGLFKSNWNKLVNTNHQCLFTLPYYHMSTEPFWQLIPNEGCELWVKSKSSMRSFKNLTTAIKYVLIDNELKELLIKEEESNILIQCLLDKYFTDTKSKFYSDRNNYITIIENQILEEPKEVYKKRLLKIRQNLDNNAYEEEVFVRSSIFKKEVPKIYKYTCCISGFRIDAVANVSMIDACHIIPFSESFNDTITNGIALCPNLHRAFDRGLISISNDYRVLINNNFSEPNETVYSISQFNGNKLLLPNDNRYYPSLDSLEYHRIKFGFE